VLGEGGAGAHGPVVGQEAAVAAPGGDRAEQDQDPASMPPRACAAYGGQLPRV